MQPPGGAPCPGLVLTSAPLHWLAATIQFDASWHSAMRALCQLGELHCALWHDMMGGARWAAQQTTMLELPPQEPAGWLKLAEQL